MDAKQLKAEFQALYEGSATIRSLLEKLQAGTATYQEAHAYAAEVSKLIGRLWQSHSADGLQAANARAFLPHLLDENYDLVSGYAQQVQQELNKKAGIGLKARKSPRDADRADGLAAAVSDPARQGQFSALVENYSRSIVDGTVKENADFQYKAGLRPKIRRTLHGKACKWCRSLAGVYDYPKKTPKDVFRRHANCTCLVEYDPGDGSKDRQNVHTKQWQTEEERDKIEARKAVGTGVLRQFRSEELLQSHFSKHSAEFGVISIPEYLRRANALADLPESNDVAKLERSDGSVSKYRFSTNEFVVIDGDGMIRTYFLPKDKEAYWKYEIGRND